MKMNIFAAVVIAVFVLVVFSAPSAHAQSVPVLMNNPTPMRMSEHAQTAGERPMAQENTLLSVGSYSYAKGEVPLIELASPVYQTPLGDIARAYRKEHALAPKAVVVFEK